MLRFTWMDATGITLPRNTPVTWGKRSSLSNKPTLDVHVPTFNLLILSSSRTSTDYNFYAFVWENLPYMYLYYPACALVTVTTYSQPLLNTLLNTDHPILVRRLDDEPLIYREHLKQSDVISTMISFSLLKRSSSPPPKCSQNYWRRSGWSPGRCKQPR